MLLRNTLTLITGSGASALLSLALAVLIGRARGDAALGAYASALAWVIPLALVVEFGVGTFITRTLSASDSPYSPRDMLRASAQARLLMGLPLMLLLWAFAPLLTADPLTARGLALSSPLVLVNPFYAAFTAVFRARRVMWAVAALNTAMLTAQVALTGVILAHGGDVLDALRVNLLTSAGQLCAAWLLWRVRFDDAPARVALPMRDLLRQALPYGVGAALAAVQLRAGVVLVERLTTLNDVGQFAAANRFFEGGRLLALAFFDALFPLLMRLAHDRARLDALTRRVLLGLSAAGIVFGGFITLTADALLRLLFGETFVQAAPLLVGLGWALWPTLLKYALGLYWYARGDAGRVNRVTAVTLVIQVAAALWLIPRFGVVAAAWLAVAVEWLAVALLWGRITPTDDAP